MADKEFPNFVTKKCDKEYPSMCNLGDLVGGPTITSTSVLSLMQILPNFPPQMLNYVCCRRYVHLDMDLYAGALVYLKLPPTNCF